MDVINQVILGRIVLGKLMCKRAQVSRANKRVTSSVNARQGQGLKAQGVYARVGHMVAPSHVFENLVDDENKSTDDWLFDPVKQNDEWEQVGNYMTVPSMHKDISDLSWYFMSAWRVEPSDPVRTVNLVSDVDDPSSIALKMQVNDHPCVAVLDTGSTITCISTRLVKTLKCMIIPAEVNDAPIQLAHSNMTVPRIGSTVPLSLDTSRRTVMHSCEVLDTLPRKIEPMF
jgi:hypothetical protein